MTHRTTPLPRFSTNGEPGTYNPPAHAARRCTNLVRPAYQKHMQPACSAAFSGERAEEAPDWAACKACPARPTTPAAVLVAPQGCGKTTHADALAKHFGCEVVTDDWNGREAVPPKCLAITADGLRPVRGDIEIECTTQRGFAALLTALAL